MKHICSKHKLIYTDRCPKCKKDDQKVYDKYKRDKELDKFYHSSIWKKVRESILKKEPLCRMCGKPATIVDHIKPIKKGGSKLDEANLQPLCHSCHNFKTMQDRKEGRV